MTYRHLGLRAVALALRRTVLFAFLAASALAPLLFSQKANQGAGQRLNPSIRTTSPAFGGTPEDSIPSWATIVLP